MSSDLNLTALFVLETFEIQLSVIPQGVATMEGNGTFSFGETVTISIDSVASGYEFDSWSGTILSSEPSLTINVNEDLNLTANFSQIVHQLTVTAGSGGSTSGSGLIPYGTLQEISATPDEGYLFSEWTGEGITDPSAPLTTISMTEDRNVTANFNGFS